MHPAGIAVCNVVSERGQRQRGGETGNIVQCRLEAGRVSDDFAFWIPGQSLLDVAFVLRGRKLV